MRVLLLRPRNMWRRKLKAIGIAITSLFTPVKITARGARYDNLLFSNRFVRSFLSLFYDVRIKGNNALFIQLRRRNRG